MRAAVLLFAGLATVPARAAAQEPPSVAVAPAAPAVVRLGVDEAVSRAIAASPRLARLSAQEAAAEAQRQGAHAERWPQIDLTAGYQYRSDVPELAIFAPTNDPTKPVERIVVFPNINDNWRLRAGVALPLYTGGRVGGQIRAAEEGRVAAQEDLRAGRSDLVLETKNAYWSLVTARESVRVLSESMKAYDAHLKDAREPRALRHGRAQRGAGGAGRARPRRARPAAGRGRGRRGRGEPAAPARPAGDLAGRAGRAPRRRRAGRRRPRGARHRGAGRPRRAKGARRARERGRGDRRCASAARGSPRSPLTGGYTYANPNRDIVPPTTEWKDTWDVGVGVSWSVLDGGRRSASEARARAQADAVAAQLRELDRAIRLEVTQRALELRTAQARLAVAERSVESAAESRRVAGDRYREGVIPSSELLDAEVAHERASLARTEALAALRLAAASLDRAVGR